jgi:hypothetical protein
MISLFTITELKFVLGSAGDKALIIVINDKSATQILLCSGDGQCI